MIIGIGTDIIQIPRVEKILTTHIDLFIEKYFQKKNLKNIKIINSHQNNLRQKLQSFFQQKKHLLRP